MSSFTSYFCGSVIFSQELRVAYFFTWSFSSVRSQIIYHGRRSIETGLASECRLNELQQYKNITLGERGQLCAHWLVWATWAFRGCVAQWGERVATVIILKPLFVIVSPTNIWNIQRTALPSYKQAITSSVILMTCGSESSPLPPISAPTDGDELRASQSRTQRTS